MSWQFTVGLRVKRKADRIVVDAEDALEEIEAEEQGAEAKFKAAQAKAEKLGGAHKLTPEDIEGLSAEQLKQLRGY